MELTAAILMGVLYLSIIIILLFAGFILTCGSLALFEESIILGLIFLPISLSVMLVMPAIMVISYIEGLIQMFNI